jgi:DNA-binding IclR family transcriptional regulator
MTGSVRSVSGAFAILRLLAGTGPLKLTAIGHDLGLSPSSCLNLLRTLVDEGAIVRDAASKAYRLSPEWAAADLFAGGRDQALIDRLRPAMAQAAGDFATTVGLWKLAPGRRLHLIAHAECDAPMRIQLATGQRQPIGSGAVGRALAAAQQADDGELARRFAEVRWQSPLPFSTYQAEVAQAARLGFAIDRGTSVTGVWSVAAALGSADPGYILSASVFAGSRGEAELDRIGARLFAIGHGALSAI